MAEKINHATASNIFGILSIVFAFFNPLAGLVLGIIGLVKANKAKSKSLRKLNTVGIVLSAIVLVVSMYLAFKGLGSLPTY